MKSAINSKVGALRPSTIGEYLSGAAERFSNQTATAHLLQNKWSKTPWPDFWNEIQVAARALQSAGVAKGDRVAIFAPPSREWEIIDFALSLCGAVVVSIDARSSTEQIRYILRDSAASWLFIQSSTQMNSLDALTITRLKTIVVIDGDRHPTLRSWPALKEGALSKVYPFSFDVKPSDPALIIYTSGTTGIPKGILFRHEQVLLALEAIRQVLPSGSAGDSTISWLPLAGMFQRIINLFALGHGYSIYFVDDSADIVRRMPEIEPTFLIGVPRFFEKLKAVIESIPVGSKQAVGRITGGRMKFMITGSAPTPVPVLSFFYSLGVPLLEAYGVSENIVPNAMNRLNDYRHGTVGRAMAGNDIKIAADGEILVKGGGVFSGYLNASAAALLTSDGYYPTGDLGHFDDRGYLVITGRKTDMIKTSTGRKIAPAHLEEAFRDIRGVEDAVVFGDSRKTLVGLLVLSAAYLNRNVGHEKLSELDPNALTRLRETLKKQIAAKNASLASYERVGAWAILDQPWSAAKGEVTLSMKIRRAAINERHRDVINQLYTNAEQNTRDSVDILFQEEARHDAR
jgi:long-chain acyl-CoA synthetase